MVENCQTRSSRKWKLKNINYHKLIIWSFGIEGLTYFFSEFLGRLGKTAIGLFRLWEKLIQRRGPVTQALLLKWVDPPFAGAPHPAFYLLFQRRDEHSLIAGRSRIFKQRFLIFSPFLKTTNDPAPRGRSPAELNGEAETLSTLTDCQWDVERTRNPRCLMEWYTSAPNLHACN